MNIFKWRAKGLRVKGLMEIQSKGKVATVPSTAVIRFCLGALLKGCTGSVSHSTAPALPHYRGSGVGGPRS